MLRGARIGPRDTPGIVGLLDIGTSKVVCTIAELGPTGDRGHTRPRVLGLGLQRSKGVKAGVITDLNEAEQAVRAAVSQAERHAGVTLEEVVISVSCGRLRSLHFTANTDVEGGVVRDGDIARVMAGGRAYAERDGRMLIHMNRIGFRLDSSASVREPRGMAARKLTADLHGVTADEAPIRNLLLTVERCHLNVRGLAAAPYASALAVTSEEERRLGVTCIDIGGGTSTIAVFNEGRFLFADSVPVGGNHVTFDIARALQTPLAQAERIKALYGTLVGAQSDAHEVFSYPLAGEEDTLLQATRAQLAAVMRPRVASLMALLKERLARGAAAHHTGERVVLTGGASQVVGIGEFAATALGWPVRVAWPAAELGLPAEFSGPAFATVAGLLAAAATDGGETVAEPEVVARGYLGRVGQWLSQGF